MKCVFCQNSKISHEGYGKEISLERLAEIFLELQQKGVHNINLVSPTQYMPQILQSLSIAKKNGLFIPIVYNCNGFESKNNVKYLLEYVDIYLTDLKYSDNNLSIEYSKTNNYFNYASQFILETFQKIGLPKFNKDGMMERGVLIRHLILPTHINDTKEILLWIYNNLGKDTYVSLMSQYTPTFNKSDYNELNYRITHKEYNQIIDYFFEIGLENGYIQDTTSSKEFYTPAFDLKGV
jgi:putative pyruvate formate lyase activating enzyme